MIEVKNITKRYGQHYAVKNVSFKANDGEILGFLGPNGAGKTTTMNIITGYISATEGDVIINGIDIIAEPEKAKRNIGYLPDSPPLYNDMKVDEYLRFVADLKKVKSRDRAKMISDVKESVGITDISNRLIKNLSKGYKQRVGLAQAIIGKPEVIIMDEPTVGLDPKQIIEMRDVIKRLGKKHTVILSSHILTEVSAVCDRIMIISKGEIKASDTTEHLSSKLSQGNIMSVRIKGEEKSIISALEQYPVIKTVRPMGSNEAETIDFQLSGDNDEDIREAIFNCMSKNSFPIFQMKSMDLTLEEIFLQITSGENADVKNTDAENPDIENVDAENPDIENADTENTDTENADIENTEAENTDAENADGENADVNGGGTK